VQGISFVMEMDNGCMVLLRIWECSSFNLEIWRAVYRLARKLGFLYCLKMDLAVLINAIKASSSSLVANRIYFKELNLLLQKDMEVRVSHTYRDRNCSADWLANAGLSTCIEMRIFYRRNKNNKTQYY